MIMVTAMSLVTMTMLTTVVPLRRLQRGAAIPRGGSNCSSSVSNTIDKPTHVGGCAASVLASPRMAASGALRGVRTVP